MRVRVFLGKSQRGRTDARKMSLGREGPRLSGAGGGRSLRCFVVCVGPVVGEARGGWAHVGRPWVRWAPRSCHLAARRVHEAGSKAVAESEEVLGVRRAQEGPFSVAV